MRVLIVCHWLPGGSSVVASELAKILARKGHEVHLVAEKRPFRLQGNSEVNFHAFEVFSYPLFPYPPHDLCLITKLSDLCREVKPQVVHAHYAVPHALAALLAKEAVGCKSRLVTTLHGTDVTLVGSHPSFFTVIKYAMERADCVTAVSGWLAKRTMEIFKLSREPEVVYNFIDYSRFNPEGRADYPENGVFEIAHASNFRPVKRVSDVIRAFHIIRKEIPARLTLIGDGPERGMIQEFVAELNLCEDVRFVGTVSSPVEIFRKSHLYLLLSDYESFGVSALEAMACGVPCVTSRSGGLPEVVEEGETGYLCAVGDYRCAAKRALCILTDKNKWKKMSMAASLRARERFSAEKVVEEYERIYRRLLD